MDLAGRAIRRALVPGAALLVLAIAWLPAAASAEVPTRTLTQSPAEVSDYWTPERMRAARPASELLADIPPVNDLLDSLLGGGTRVGARAAAPVSDPAKAPFRTNGKVFFSLPSGNYVCSATAVRAKTKRLVVTAGHCVWGDNTFASNWMFVPGKSGSSEPYGRWTAGRLATTPKWRSSEDLRFDVGMATIRKLKGRRLQDVVGARGIAFHRGRNLGFAAFGYPARSPFSGNDQYRCVSPAQGTDSGPDPKPTRIDCDMTGGASGGGWVIAGEGRVNSLTSYGYETFCALPPLICSPNPEAGKLFGPYFGNAVRDLYRQERLPARLR